MAGHSEQQPRHDDVPARDEIAFALMWIFGFATIVVWIAEVYSWARSGTPLGLTVRGALAFLGYDLRAVYEPQDWHGIARLARALTSLPLAVASPLIAIGSVWLLSGPGVPRRQSLTDIDTQD